MLPADPVVGLSYLLCSLTAKYDDPQDVPVPNHLSDLYDTRRQLIAAAQQAETATTRLEDRRHEISSLIQKFEESSQ